MWFALALAAAVTQAGQFAVVKGRARSLSPLVLIFWTQTLGLTVWMAYFLATGAPYRMTGPMWPWVLSSVVLASTMSYLLLRASAGGDISIVGPVLALSPIFAILPDFLFSGTLPQGLGWLGIGLSVVGTASLSRSASGGLDIRGLVRREDAVCAFAAAVLLGVLAGVDRRSVLAVGVPTYLVSMHAVMWAGCAALVLLRGRRAFATALAPAHLRTVLAHGALVTAGTILLMSAMTLAPAAYVNSVRRVASVVSVLLGHTIFAEPALGSRLTGALLASLGAAFLLMAR
ncbi:MAG TPA: DMT family transporter [Candidatus Limnocylindria bacterium]|nr:DMT family transporter [Candidatus Limnocylindria bacterium]